MSSVPDRGIVAFGLVATAVTVGLLVSPERVVVTLEAVAADPVVFGLVVAGCYLLRPALAWPTTPLAGLVGFGFGIVAGVPIALAGVVVTVTPTFLVATRVDGGHGSVSIDTTDGGRAARARAYVDRFYETVGPTRGVVASRLAPIPSDVATLGAAVHGVSLPRFLVGTAIGELPWTIAAVTVGASAATLSEASVRSIDPTLVVGGLLASALVLAGPLYRSVSDQTTQQTGTP
ncbi:TVP38/TMEM64 family protein [Halovivax cerinus]|uniref:TVP38/TMEM64 family protein n=1 Tax=Halovivax cerinus TaxID=1487865 RepID=A0ABD5NND9_9EURY|nr:VTT domain-containing protein [Halovivax cerinus]